MIFFPKTYLSFVQGTYSSTSWRVRNENNYFVTISFYVPSMMFMLSFYLKILKKGDDNLVESNKKQWK